MPEYSEISIRRNLFGQDDRAIYEGEDARLFSEDAKKSSSEDNLCSRRDDDALIGDLNALTLIESRVGVITRLAARRAAAEQEEEAAKGRRRLMGRNSSIRSELTDKFDSDATCQQEVVRQIGNGN